MLSTILKHLIYEQVIDVAFSAFQNNFKSYTNNIKLRDKLKWIEIRFTGHKGMARKKYTLTDVHVLFMDSKTITVGRAKEEIPAGASYMERILLTNIIRYEIK